MALLAATLYDPASAVGFQISSSSLTNCAAMDTTNLRLTFTAPASGRVIVRMQFSVYCSTNAYGTTVGVNPTQTPSFLMGVTQSGTIKGRMRPVMGSMDAQYFMGCEAALPITGLTGGTNYTWDAAFQGVVANNGHYIWIGGPTSGGGQIGGGFAYEIFG